MTGRGEREVPIGGLRLVVGVLAFLVAGGLLGAVGSFSLPTPGWAAVIGIFATPLLIAIAVWSSGRVLVGTAGYAGWLAVVIVFTMPRHFDSAVISGTTAGDAFVYGASGTGVAALALSPLLTVRPLRRRPLEPQPPAIPLIER